jgi:predicted RNA-binding Zn-ribbon protein involved in translation (DUF1610 family)
MLAAKGVLCESCGYDLGALPVAAACPECGRAIAKSLTGHREGSAWQASQRWGGTVRAVLLRPRELFQIIRIERAASNALFLRNASISSLIIIATTISLAAANPGSVQFRTGAVVETYSPMGYTWGVFALAPWITMLFDSRLSPPLYRWIYGWPVSRTCYEAVRGHASASWLVFALAIAAAAFGEAWLLKLAEAQGSTRLADIAGTAGTAVFLLGAGYVTWLHHLGVRECRFAREEAPGAPTGVTPGPDSPAVG